MLNSISPCNWEILTFPLNKSEKVNFESALKVVPNYCNAMFWCISITNNVKSCKKFSEKAQTGKITVFTMVNQHCGAENMEK